MIDATQYDQDLDRPRGILSEADRKYLVRDARERKEAYSYQAQRSRRLAIVERTSNAIRDFSVLFEELDEGELEKVAENVEMRGEERVMGGPRPPSVPITDALAFIYLLHEGEEQFEMSLNRSLRDVLFHDGQSDYNDVDISIDVEINIKQCTFEDVQMLKRKVDEGDRDALNRPEQEYLLDLLPTDAILAAFDGGDDR